MFCTKCGVKLEENTKFCTSCGAPASSPTVSNAGGSAQAQPTGNIQAAQTEITQASRETAAAMSVAPSPPMAQSPGAVAAQPTAAPSAVPAKAAAPTPQPAANPSPLAERVKRLGETLAGKRRVLVWSAGIVVAAVIAFFAYAWLLKSDSEAQLFYVKDNSIFFKSESMKKSVAITKELLDDADSDDFETDFGMPSYVQVNDSRDKLFFLDEIDQEEETGSLFMKELGDVSDKKEDKGTSISSNVSSFKLANDGEVVAYLKGTNDESKLYFNDMKQEVLVDRDVTSYYVSDDGKQLMYVVTDEDHSETLYARPLKEDGTKTKIDSDLHHIVTYTADFSKVYYQKNDDSEDHNAGTLYVKEAGKDKVKLVSGFDSIVSSSSEGSFYYMKQDASMAHLYDFVNDDMLKEDQKTAEPTEPIEPSETSFQRQVAQTGYWGDIYYDTVTDYDAYNEAYDKYRKAYESYSIANDKYNAKVERDQLRDELKAAKLEDTKSSLYLFDGKKEQLIAKDVDHTSLSDVSNGIVVYNKIAASKMKKIAISTIYNTSDVESAYRDQDLSDPKLYISVKGGKEAMFWDKPDYTADVNISEDGTKLYVLESKDGEEAGELKSYTVTASGAQDKKTVAKDVAKYAVSGNNLLFYSNVTDNVGDLNTTIDGTNKKIASDVQVGYTQMLENANTLIYYTDYSEKSMSGSLNLYEGGKSKKLADDVYDYRYVNADLIYYISDYSSRNNYGDLWELRKAKDKKLIDDQVNFFL
ncbi:zinc ribbon domain-containing protein [Paenibacillus sp. MMS18-CY102]|uniref:zinc ribbon domain-containing protein n=1 Tax=Paenibacillus sp. MMS18-CY102 TaxID=2682849 RepID=UPI001365CC64|nr:zinc ribbon domain-containing protein [Paenibacillus sp. MMS18-CY102]MWC27714.1 zinc-ribbon domain-containing protein [Paenibacillus sp. MMS18-CY102]